MYCSHIGATEFSGDKLLHARRHFMMTLRKNGSFPPTVPSVSVQKPANTVRRPFEVYMRQGIRLKLACTSFQKVIHGCAYPAIFN